VTKEKKWPLRLISASSRDQGKYGRRGLFSRHHVINTKMAAAIIWRHHVINTKMAAASCIRFNMQRSTLRHIFSESSREYEHKKEATIYHEVKAMAPHAFFFTRQKKDGCH